MWADAYRRLAEAGERIGSLSAPDAELLRLRMRARAAQLATPLPSDEPVELVDFIVFRVGVDRFAIETAAAEEVISIEALTPLPGIPAPYRGLITRRGAVYPVIDLRALVERPIDAPLAPSYAVLFRLPVARVAIGAHEIEPFLRIAPTDVAPPPPEAAAGAVRGMTADGILVLDAPALLADARLVVDQHLSPSELAPRQ